MNIFTDFIDRIVAQYATKHKETLLKKPRVKDFLEKHDKHYQRWAAYGALKDTPLDVGLNPNYTYDSPNYDRIPKDWLTSLKYGTFPDYEVKKTSKNQRKEIQQIFTHGDDDTTVGADGRYRGGYLHHLNNGFHQSAEEYLKIKWTSSALILAVIVAIVGFGGHSYLKHKADVKYWAAINTPQLYSGDGFTENFPCSQITSTNDLVASADISSKTSSCEYFGGTNHEAIDTYSVHVEHFLTNKYDPASEVACGDPMHFTGNADTQVYYNETRKVDGLTWVICGVGQYPMFARLQSSNNVFTLEALPRVEKNTAADLDSLIRGFQLN